MEVDREVIEKSDLECLVNRSGPLTKSFAKHIIKLKTGKKTHPRESAIPFKSIGQGVESIGQYIESIEEYRSYV